MKILHVYKTFINDTMGGTQQVIASIIRNNPDPSLEFSVLSLSSRPTGVDHSFPLADNIHYKESFSIASNPVSFSLLRDFGSIAKEYDLIHYHFPWPFADLMRYVWKVDKPSIVTYHSDIIRQQKLLYLYTPLMKNFLNSADRLVATSQKYLDSSSVLQSYKDKSVVIPIGIQKSDYPEPRQERLTYWKNRFGDKFFLFVGVMRYYKGLHVLLEAMAGTNFPVVIVGCGPIESKLKLRAKELNLPNVHFVGKLPDEDKISLLKLCLSLVFPSNVRSEAFGISLLEGAMFGKPLISTEIGTGTSYINDDGETGVVVPPNDHVALREAMDYIWNHPDESSRMGQKSQLRFESLFTASKMSAEYGKLYRQVLADSKCVTSGSIEVS
ncbi:MAG: glycosyltransferase [Legionellaceae bacterium]|nr:glycosyltransferase [Legionellaceae bacterium]